MTRLPPLSALLFLVWAGLAEGHAIEARRLDGGVGVEAVYDDGSPASFSEVKLYAPGSGAEPVFTGTTDRGGRFMFLPDTNGVWRLTVDDGMGHATQSEINWNGNEATSAPPSSRMPRWQGVVTGLSLLFGLFGWGAFLRMKQQHGAGT